MPTVITLKARKLDLLTGYADYGVHYSIQHCVMENHLFLTADFLLKPESLKSSIKFMSSEDIIFVRSALFWDITRRRVVIVYRRFGTAYRPHFQGSRVRAEKKAATVT
jgi:hypothetical protein